MKSLLSKLSWFNILFCIFVILVVILASSGSRQDAKAKEDTKPTATKTSDERPIPKPIKPTQTPIPAMPEQQEATSESSLPNPSEPPCTPDNPSENECTEEPVEEPKRENFLYYVDDSGYRYDCPIEYQDYLWAKCKEAGIEVYYELMLAMIYHESKFDPTVVSRTNDYGLMQINSCNHNWLQNTLGITDFLDPYSSIDAGVYIMSGYLLKYKDIHMALMCYNMGEGGAKRSGQTSSTYSRGVVADMDKLQLLEEG